MEHEFGYNPKKYKQPYETPIKNPWQTKEKTLPSGSRMQLNTFYERFDSFVLDNFGLDVETKRAALKIAKSVVSIKTFNSERLLFKGSGTVTNSVAKGDTYESTIVTAATLILDSENVSSDVKVEVCLYDGKVYDAEVFAFDLHFNVASIKMKSAAPLATATIVELDDTITIDPSSTKEFQHCEPSNSFKISPGDMVIAVGRSHEYPFKLMSASGEFSLASCNFDCTQLFRGSCKISKSGTGGPLINRNGDVIGVDFYEELYTPFLPMNIVSKCLEQFERFRRVRRPWLGLEVINLYAATLDKLERVIHKFPNTFTGVIVEEVISDSPAEVAGILPGDVICQCNGNTIKSFLEFFGIILENVGDFVELAILRETSGEKFSRTLKVAEIPKDKIYRWPISEERWTITRYR